MPSKVDPNVYAMSIQLSLESSDAFASLDAFSKQVSDLETELSNAAQKSMLSLGQVSAEATKGVESINAAFMKTEGITVKIHTNLEAATKEINDQFDKGEEQLENVEETHKLMVKMQKIQLNMGKELGKHLKINDAFLDGTEKIVDAVHRKNIGHQEQNKLLANDVAEAKRMAGEIGGVTDEVKEAEKAWMQVKAAMKQVWGLIKQIDADTEKFVTTNYRAYGSQQQLVQGARNLAMEHQVSYENAVAAYQVLGNLKVPRDEMDKYAKVVAIANRTTGVGVQQVGEYVNRLRLAGFSAQQAERSVAHMTEAMRKFGLNTHDVNALMNQSAANAKSAARNFGGGAEELKKWEESRVTMAAFARTAGHSAEELAGFENWILNDVAAMELFKAQTNTTETGIDGFRLAMLRAGLETNKQMEEIEAGIRNGTRDVSERIAMEQTLIKTYYGGNRAAYESARAMGKAAKEAGVLGDKVEDLDKISGIAANTMENQLGEANNTLTGQLKILGSTVWSVLGSVLQLAADAIMPLVKALNWLIRQVMWVLSGFTVLDNFLRKHIPGYETLAAVVKWVVGIVIALAVGIVFLTTAVSTFATVFSGASSVVAGAGRVIASFGQMILGVARIIGEAIKILLQAIGQGLAALGKAVQPVIVPLLALGLAFLLVGIGAYFFAMALRIVVQEGTAMIPAAIGMIIVIAILGRVLIGLAMLVQGPVALGLIVLSIAFVAVGLAALMTGLGLMYAGMGVQMLAGALSFKLILQIGLLGVVLIGLGMMAFAAFPGLTLLSIVMVILALAAMLLLGSMSGLGDELKKLAGAEAGNIAEVGLKFLIAGISFVIAAGLMLAASVMFYFAAPMMLAAVAIMNAAAAVMMPMAFMLLISGVILLVASVAIFAASILLLPASLMLLVSAVMIYAGSAIMLVGAVMLIEASLLLMIGGGLLMGAGISLMIGLLLIEDSASDIFAIGMKIGVGGMMLLMGAQAIVIAAQMLGSSADHIDSVMNMLSGLVPSLMRIAGGLGTAGFIFNMSGGSLQVAAANILASGRDMMAGSTMLMMGAVILDQAVTLLVSGAIRLFESAFLLRSSSEALAWAGHWLVPAAFTIYTGMRWLEYAIERFSKTVDSVEKISKAVAMLSTSFQVLSSVNLGAFKDSTAKALSAVPDIEQMGDRLMTAAVKLAQAVEVFRGPADELARLFERLGAATATFASGIQVADDVAKLADMLDKYATLLEGTTQRIEAAVNARAIPAMKAAEEAGIEEAVRSEAITTVQVMDETDGDVAKTEEMENSAKMIDLLQSLDDRLADMQGGSKGELTDILSLLQAYLPTMGKGDSGLGSEFNAWSK